jgi:hypothetical protein
MTPEEVVARRALIGELNVSGHIFWIYLKLTNFHAAGIQV